MNDKPERILSLDPGIIVTGYSVVDMNLTLLERGTIKPERKDDPAPVRIDQICEDLEALLDIHRPDHVVVEWCSGFVNEKKFAGQKIAQIAAKLAVLGAVTGELRRTAIQWARRIGAKVHAIPENTWTRGRPKDERALAVAELFPAYKVSEDKGLHVADALALAAWFQREQAVRRAMG